MSTENCWNEVRKKLVSLTVERADGLDTVIRYLVLIAENIVDDYKEDREFHKNADSTFRFWTYVPQIERGASSVVIRWRRYTGRGRHSCPVSTSTRKDYRIPMTFFPGCTKSERRAIRKAEDQFSKIRQLNEKILIINKAHNALIDMTGARALIGSPRKNQDGEKQEMASDAATESPQGKELKPLTEAEQIKFRRRIGLDR